MKRKTLLYFLSVAALIVALSPSCKKKEETEVLPSLSGTLYYVVAPYYRAGDVVTLKPTGLTHPDGKEIGFWWIVPFGDKANQRDTVETVTFTIPEDTEGQFSVTCCGFATGYYSTSVAEEIFVVDPQLGGTLTESGILPHDTRMVDSRDTKENVYYTLSAGGLTWMRNNLAWTGAGVPYSGCEVLSYPLGRYYTWEEAQTACPEGWRLPTDEEWETFGEDAGALMVNARWYDERLWEYWPEVNITNSSRMSVIPSGYALRGDFNQFKGVNNYAVFWTATTDPADASLALCRYINVKLPEIFVDSRDKASFGASVRCVK